MKILPWAARIFVAAIFFYAGLVKLGASERFAITVADFALLPAGYAQAFGLSLAVGETLAATMLLIPRTTRLGAGILAALLLAFIAALTWALEQGFIVDCGCFGEDPAPSRGKMIFAIWRDVALLALTLPLAWTRRR